MPSRPVSPVLPLLAILAAAVAACGPRPAPEVPIQRGTALPPPGVTLAPAR